MMRPRVGLALLALLCAGCASVPTPSRVVTGRPAERTQQVDEPSVRLIAVGPGKDWSPQEIVQGFLIASGSFDEKHQYAREYLAPGVTWTPDPSPQVAVYSDQKGMSFPNVTDGPVSTVEVKVDRLGSIFADGQYSAETTQKSIDVSFQLKKNGQGQWRITALPPILDQGLLLSRNDVDRTFRTRNLYYFAPDGLSLVPNPIFLPLVNRSDLPSQLVRREIAGPTEWLKEAVVSMFPAGTKLLGGVDVSADGEATVNLSREAASGNAKGMAAQLIWTLKQLAEVKRLRLEINGRTVFQTPDPWAPYSPDSSLANAAKVGYYRDSAGHLMEQRYTGAKGTRVEALANTKIYNPAVSLDQYGLIAGLSADSKQLITADPHQANSVRQILTAGPGATFSQPSWDRHGNLWAVESTASSSVLWYKEPKKDPVRVAAWDLSAFHVSAFRVALDGVRVAAIASTPGNTQIMMGRITRDRLGQPKLEYFQPISSDFQEVSDLAWASADDLVVLGRQQTATSTQPYDLSISGQVSLIGISAPNDSRTITAAPGLPILIGAQNNGQDVLCSFVSTTDPYSEWDCNSLGQGADPTYPG